MSKQINIAIAGVGNVGMSVLKYLIAEKSFLEKRLAKTINISAISSRTDKKIAKNIVWNSNPLSLINDNNDIIIELIGGADGIAYELIKKALQAKKNIVTANKALLAKHGNELFVLAKKNNVELFFEAAIVAAIPVVKMINKSLISNKISEIYGILNGTCNFILSSMAENKISFDNALKIAQEKGFAEADPTADVDGFDTAHKIILLSFLSFNSSVSVDLLDLQGIRDISSNSFIIAEKLGYKIKLLAKSKLKNNYVSQYVYPFLLPKKHHLANVDGAMNSVYIKSDLAEELVLTGYGAGAKQTSSAIISDLCNIIDGEKNKFCTDGQNIKYKKEDNSERKMLIHCDKESDFDDLLKIIAKSKTHKILKKEKMVENYIAYFVSINNLELQKIVKQKLHQGIFEIY